MQFFQSRRAFLTTSASLAASVTLGNLLGQRLFAEHTQLVAKVKEAPASHPLIPALDLGTKALEALEEVKDYEARFIKREHVGRQLVNTTMDLKLREEPFSVYLKFIKPHAGREVLFVENRNDGMIQVHDVGLAGLAGTISLDPTGPYAMDENRHSITQIGLRNMVSTLLEQWLEETKLEGTTVNYYPNATIGQLSCRAVEVTYRRPQEGVKFQTCRLYVEDKSGLPVRLQTYDFAGKRDKEPVLLEDYFYSNLRTNVGLTDNDFSTGNPKYDF